MVKLYYNTFFILFGLDLDNRLDLDQSIQRQGVGTDGTSGVIADGLVKDLHNHIGTPIHDLMMKLEIGRGVDNSKDLLIINPFICSENEYIVRRVRRTRL